MATPQTTNVAILGGGNGGVALLDLLGHLPDVTGMADKNPSAPGIRLAREQGLRITSDVADLIERDSIDLLVDVTVDPSVEPLIQSRKPPGAEVLSGAAARLLSNLVQHQTQIHMHLFSAEKLASIGTFASGLAHDINNPLYLIMGTAENLLEEQDLATAGKGTTFRLEFLKG